MSEPVYDDLHQVGKVFSLFLSLSISVSLSLEEENIVRRI